MTTRISANPFTRRAVLISAASAALAPGAFLRAERRKPLLARLGEVEEKSGGRLGCAVLDTASGHRFAYRGTDRFPMCSTFKLLAVALVLRRVDRGEEQLERRIVYSREDVLSYAPVTSLHVQDGMTVEELCAAAITLSDNTAANLLLKSFGGPAGLNDFLRGIGDSITRLDRTEPTLNEAAPGDDRDTTTPSMMLEDMRRLLLGDVLKPDARGRLTHWLVDCKTGDTRLRGGLPPEWKAGDKNRQRRPWNDQRCGHHLAAQPCAGAGDGLSDRVAALLRRSQRGLEAGGSGSCAGAGSRFPRDAVGG